MSDAAHRITLSILKLIPKAPTKLDGVPLISAAALIPLDRLCKGLARLLRTSGITVAGVHVDQDGAWCISMEIAATTPMLEGMHLTADQGVQAVLDAFALVALPMQEAPAAGPAPPALPPLPADGGLPNLTANEHSLHKALFGINEHCSVHINGLDQPVEPRQKSRLVSPGAVLKSDIDDAELVQGNVAACFHSLIDTTVVLVDRRQIVLTNKSVEAGELKRVNHQLKHHATAAVFLDYNGDIEKEVASMRRAREKASDSKPRQASRKSPISSIPGMNRPGTRRR